MGVTSVQIDLLAQLLDTANTRHQVIAQNVANVNTPGYRQLEVRFEDALAEALRPGNESAALGVKAQVVPGPGGPERQDGNNVDIDMEMGKINQNSMLYKVYAQVLALHLSQMRSAISGH